MLRTGESRPVIGVDPSPAGGRRGGDPVDRQPGPRRPGRHPHGGRAQPRA